MQGGRPEDRFAREPETSDTRPAQEGGAARAGRPRRGCGGLAAEMTGRRMVHRASRGLPIFVSRA